MTRTMTGPTRADLRVRSRIMDASAPTRRDASFLARQKREANGNPLFSAETSSTCSSRAHRFACARQCIHAVISAQPAISVTRSGQIPDLSIDQCAIVKLGPNSYLRHCSLPTPINNNALRAYEICSRLLRLPGSQVMVASAAEGYASLFESKHYARTARRTGDRIPAADCASSVGKREGEADGIVEH